MAPRFSAGLLDFLLISLNTSYKTCWKCNGVLLDRKVCIPALYSIVPIFTETLTIFFLIYSQNFDQLFIIVHGSSDCTLNFIGVTCTHDTSSKQAIFLISRAITLVVGPTETQSHTCTTTQPDLHSYEVSYLKCFWSYKHLFFYDIESGDIK